MRMRLFLSVLLLAVSTAGVIYAQITANPIPAPVEKRGLMVEIKDLCGCPTPAGGVRPIRT